MLHTKRNLKIVFGFLLCFVTACKEQPHIPLCTDRLIEEVVLDKFAGDQDAIKLWEKLEKDRIVSMSGTDEELRAKFVGLQYAFEVVAATSIKNGATNAIAVTYTPAPPTPLRVTSENLPEIVSKEVKKDEARLDSVISRQTSLNNYFENGGILYSVHKFYTPKTKGVEEYKINLQKYNGKLIDRFSKKIDKSHIGSSYILQCADGKKVFFSIKGNQASYSKKSEWNLYYGNPYEKKLKKFFEELQELYLNSGVLFEFKPAEETAEVEATKPEEPIADNKADNNEEKKV